MANIHTPERQAGESFTAYKDRRAESNLIGRAMRTIGKGGVSSRQQFRDSLRASGNMGKRIRASDALMAAWASKRVVNWSGPRDKHGAYTTVGSVYTLSGVAVEPTSREHILGGAVGGGMEPEYTLRRKWLAGISAQRGY